MNFSIGYLWGRILGIILILKGGAVIVGVRLFPRLDPFLYEQTVLEWNSPPMYSAFVVAAIFMVLGVLILFKKALGWYLLYLMLVLVGIGIPAFLVVVIGSDFSKIDTTTIWFAIVAFVLTLLCWVFLWIQVKYCRSRAI